MALDLWSPLAELDRDWRFDLPSLLRQTRQFRPSMDVVKENDHLVVTAEVPGMSADDVDVSLEDDVLTIKGEKSEEREVSEDNRFVRERSFGSFQRRITVPAGVSSDDVTADLKDGVLTVRIGLPDGKAAEPKKIPVGTTS